MTVLVARRITGGENCSSLYEKVTRLVNDRTKVLFRQMIAMHEKLNITDWKLRVSDDNVPLI